MNAVLNWLRETCAAPVCTHEHTTRAEGEPRGDREPAWCHDCWSYVWVPVGKKHL